MLCVKPTDVPNSTIMNSIQLFEDGFNCAQALFVPLALETNIDTELAFKIMSPFGGGLSHSNNICGAVSGAIAAIGLKFGHYKSTNQEDKQKCRQIAQKFIAEFTAAHGSVNCTKLIGFNLNDDSQNNLAKEANVFKIICPKLVESASIIVKKLLDENQ